SRRRHTRFSRDWSSDVCSSDLQAQEPVADDDPLQAQVRKYEQGLSDLMDRRTELQRAKGQSSARAQAAVKDLNQFLGLLGRDLQIGRASGRESGGNAEAPRMLG